MLIGFNLAPVVATLYWPQDHWVAVLVMVFAIACAVGLRGFFGRISIFLALIFGTILSWIFDRIFGMITSLDSGTGTITPTSGSTGTA
jgi:xanthine/uracil permease